MKEIANLFLFLSLAVQPLKKTAASWAGHRKKSDRQDGNDEDD